MAQRETGESTGHAETDGGVDGNPRRQDYLTWEEYYMSVAYMSAQRSKDPRTQVGACIVNKNKRIVGIGYNGMPDRCHDDKMPWYHSSDDRHVLETKDLYVCHAELNAIVNKFSADLDDSTMYVTLFPCNTCAQLIIQSGIKKVVYASDSKAAKPAFKASRKMLEVAGVGVEEFKTERPKVKIDFRTGEVKIR